MRRHRLLAGLLLAVFVCSFAPTVHAQQIGAPTPDLESLRPPQRLWDELKVLQAQFLLPWSEVRVDDCPLLINAARPTNQVYQNILYANYLWDEHELLSGNRCIVLRVPDVGPLNADDARILLSASAGLGFEEQGFFAQAEESLQQLASALFARSCGGNSSSPLPPGPSTSPVGPGAAPASTQGAAGLGTGGGSKPGVEGIFALAHDERPEPAWDLVQVDCTQGTSQEGGTTTLGVDNGVIGTDNRARIQFGLDFDLPRSTMVQLRGTNRSVDPFTGTAADCREHGSGFYLNPWSIITVAHNVRHKSCRYTDWVFRPYAFPFFEEPIVGSAMVAPGWNGNPLQTTQHDYAVMQTLSILSAPIYPRVETASLLQHLEPGDIGRATGYPLFVGGQHVHGGLYRGQGSMLPDSSRHLGLFISNFDNSPGMSGGAFEVVGFPDRASGVVEGTACCTGSGNYFNIAVPIEGAAASQVFQWLADPPPDFAMSITRPQFNDVFDLRNPASPAWQATILSLGSRSAPEGSPEVIWESDIDGVFATGETIAPDLWRHSLGAGVHTLTVRATSPDEVAEDVVVVELIGPAGTFTSPSTDPASCSLGFKHQGAQTSCDITIAWTTDMAPDAVVWNATDNVIFATGASGSQVWPTTERPTTFQIYESSAREFVLDEVTVSAFVDARPAVTLAAARCPDGLCAAILGQNFAPDVCVQARALQEESSPILATFCGADVNRTFHPESGLFSLRVPMDHAALRSLYINQGLYLYVINTADDLFDGGYFLKRPRGNVAIAAPCTVTASGQTCGVGLSGETFDSPFACLWRAADQRLVTCTPGGSFDLSVPATTSGEVIELRALEVPAEDTSNWPDSRFAVYADSPLLDSLVVAADGPDPFENDDDASQWKAYEGTPQQRNFFDDNIDWIGVFRGGPTTFETTDLTNRVNTCLRVYRANATNDGIAGPALGEDCRIDLDVTATVTLDLPAAPAGYLIQVLNLGAQTGPSTRYQLEIRSATTTQIDPRLGTWYNPSRTGNGIDLFETTDGRIGLVWYTFEANGMPVWYHSGLTTIAGGTWNAVLRKSTWDGSEASSVTVGSVQLDFHDPTTATFGWTLDGQSGSEPFQHLFGGGGRSGVWHAPSESGWGIETLEDNGLLGAVVTFYVGSEPRWAGGVQSAGSDVTIPLRWRTGTGLCPSCSGGSTTPPPSVDAGTLRLQIPHGTSTSGIATTSITTPSGATWNRGPVTIELLTAP